MSGHGNARYLCSHCNIQTYTSKIDQVMDWENHKTYCKNDIFVTTPDGSVRTKRLNLSNIKIRNICDPEEILKDIYKNLLQDKLKMKLLLVQPVKVYDKKPSKCYENSFEEINDIIIAVVGYKVLVYCQYIIFTPHVVNMDLTKKIFIDHTSTSWPGLNLFLYGNFTKNDFQEMITYSCYK
jgi:hypothetical protein